MTCRVACLGVRGITLLAVAGLCSSSAHASKFWKNSVINGSWNNNNNWSAVSAANSDNGGVPLPNEPVNIVFTDGTARSVTYDVGAPNSGLLSIDLTGAGAGAATLLMPNGNNFTAAAIFVGGYSGSGATSGRGTINQSTGSVRTLSGTDLVVGHGAGSTGTYTLSGSGTLEASQSEYIGYSGAGTFNQSAGTNTIDAGAIGGFDVGIFSGATGTYNLSGTGTLVCNKSEYIGDIGIGLFNHTGGSNTIQNGQNLFIGNSAGGLGTYTLSAGTFSVAGNEYLGFSATGNGSQSGGRFIQTGGSSNVGGTLSIGINSGATGNYTISGSGSLVANNLIVGNSGTATMTIQNSASVHVSNNLSINNLSALNLNGGILRFDTATGLNRVNFTGGTIKLASQRVIGTDPSIAALFGASPAIPSGKGLTVEGSTQVQTNLAVNGGKFIGLSDVQLGVAGSSPVSISITNAGTAIANTNLSVGSTEVSTAGGAITVDGVGSTLQTLGNMSFGHVAPGTLQVINGGLVTTSGNATIGATGTNGQGTATVNGPGSTWNIAGNLSLSGAPSGLGTLNIQNQALVYVGGGLTIDTNNVVNLNGGTFRLNTVDGPSLSRINYSAGMIQLTGNRNVSSDPIVQTLFGEAPTIPAGKGLIVEGTATLQANLALNGGSFSANQVVNPQFLHVQHGTLDVTNQAGTIGSGEVLDLAADATINYGLGITNQGLIKGDGQLGGAVFQNTSAGEIVAETNKSLAIAALSNVNDGKMTLAGGSLLFAQQLANNSGGTISGNGTISTNGSLVNYGTMNFNGVSNVNVVGDLLDYGDTNVTGILTINAAKIEIEGMKTIAENAFWIAVSQAVLSFGLGAGGELHIHHGTIVANHGILVGTPQRRAEIDGVLADIPLLVRADYNQAQQELAQYTEQLLLQGHLAQPSQAEASQLNNDLDRIRAVLREIRDYYDSFTQTQQKLYAASTIIADTEVQGTFVAGGTAGISVVDVVGDLSIDAASSLEMELAGTNPGQFDTIQVDGNASFELGAHLVLSMLDPSDLANGTHLFLPKPGDFFDVLTADSVDAEFILIDTPQFDNRAFVAGVVNGGSGQVLRVTVVPVGLPGDYNQDGVVDAADYVLWRKYNNTSTDLRNDDSPGVDQTDYDVWRTHFGQTAVSASGASVNAAVPEPTTQLLLMFAAAGWCLRRGRDA